MKISYIILTMSLILITAAISLGGQNMTRETNETCIQYELKLSTEAKTPYQQILFESDSFMDEQLELEDWMTDYRQWN